MVRTPDFWAKLLAGSWIAVLKDNSEKIELFLSYVSCYLSNCMICEDAFVMSYYFQDAYITRTDFVEKFSVSNVLVFSPLMILILTVAFTLSFVVEKKKNTVQVTIIFETFPYQVAHLLFLRMRFPSKESFWARIFNKKTSLPDLGSNDLVLYRFY